MVIERHDAGSASRRAPAALWPCLALLVGLLFVVGACAPSRPSAVRPVRLTCDNRPEAAGVSVERPGFGWEIAGEERGERQSACRILVASAPELLAEGRADVWDSGKRRTAESAFVVFEGPRLAPGRTYFWKVRVWDRRGRPSAWSETASFVTELAAPADWAGARWIACEELPDAEKIVPGVHGNGDELGAKGLRRPVVPAFRREFDIGGEPVKRALVFVSGLGQYELRLNGAKAGASFLSPGWTDYRKRCLYNTYDVTTLVRLGRNAIAALVGNGFFNIDRERYRKLVIAYGMPMMIVRLEVEFVSGRRVDVVSGPDWKTAPSPITFSSIYGGEDYDARFEQPGWDEAGFDDGGWRGCLVVAGPGGRLEAERDFPLEVMAEIPVKAIREPRPGVFVYDFGQNASGIVSLKVAGPRGRTVTISPAELLDKNGLANQSASGSPFRLTYTLKGGGAEEWAPRFTYYGFRYAQVEGAVPDGATGEVSSATAAAAGKSALGMAQGNNSAGSSMANPESAGRPVILELKLLHTRNAAPEVGRFACSKDLFNRTFVLIDWAIRSNLASVPTDCPHREKLGWLEQTHLMGGSIQYNYRILTLYRKLVTDMMEAQLDDGLVPDIAPEFVPFVGGFRDSPEWGSAAVILPWLLYQWYGDRETMAAAWPMMRRYVDYLGTKTRNRILGHGLGDWFDLGPKPPGEAQLTPRALTATAIYYHDIDLLARMAQALGKASDAVDLAMLGEEVRRAFNRQFFDPSTRMYATGSQTSYAMPLHFGIVDAKERAAVFANLVRSIREGGGALTAGDVGFDYLLKALAEGGASDVIYEMNSREDVPGYGWQLARGATALTESWAAREDVSNNHMMLGHLMEWFYAGLAGIGQEPGSRGFERIVIKPEPVGDVTWVKASHHSIRGEIAVDWKIEGGRFALDVTIPANATATVYVPVGEAIGVPGSSGKGAGANGPAKAAGGTSGQTGGETRKSERTAAFDVDRISEGGVPARHAAGVRFLRLENGWALFAVGSGVYHFVVPTASEPVQPMLAERSIKR